MITVGAFPRAADEVEISVPLAEGVQKLASHAGTLRDEPWDAHARSPIECARVPLQ